MGLPRIGFCGDRMTRTAGVLLLGLTVALTACGGTETGPEEGVVDFSGSWTVRADFSYLPEDIACSITDIALTVSQTDATLTGSSTGGTMSCSQTGTDWPSSDVVDLTLSGNARPNSVIFQLQGGELSLSFSGLPRSSRFDGTFQGSAVIEAFDIGDVTISGSWTASR